jgi:hypothetical protein
MSIKMLPTIKSPTFTIKTKEFKKPVSVRPMVVAEHKALQQANDIGSDLDLMITIGNIVASCTENAVTAKSSERFLLDYLFIQIYMTSVDDVITTRYTCRKEKVGENGDKLVDEETGDVLICNTSFDFKIPLSMVAIKYPDDYVNNKVVEFDDNTTLFLKAMSLDANIEIESLRLQIDTYIEELQEISYVTEYTVEQLELIDRLKKNIDDVTEEIRNTIIYRSIDNIKDGDNIMKAELDFSKEEFINWLGTIPTKATRGIDNFITNQPYVHMNADIVCPKCGHSRNIDLRGLKDFFS